MPTFPVAKYHTTVAVVDNVFYVTKYCKELAHLYRVTVLEACDRESLRAFACLQFLSRVIIVFVRALLMAFSTCCHCRRRDSIFVSVNKD